MEETMTNLDVSRSQPQAVSSSPVRDSCFWDKRASSFTDYARGTGYAASFLQFMKVNPDWTVLDMACAGGTLAVPLAGKVKSVTAVDFSKNMLSILENRCRDKGISNVKTVHGRWEDDWNDLGIGMHDVAVASRSLPAEDVEGSIIKLNAVAKRQVYLSVAVGDGPFDRRLIEAAGRALNMGPDYIYFYNILYRLGIQANLAFIREDHENSWETFNEALEAQYWMFDDLTETEEDWIKDYLLEHLLFTDGRWRLPYGRTCRWAVMWWEKGPKP